MYAIRSYYAVFCVVIDLIACCGFVVGQLGLVHLTWTVPVANISVVLGFFFLASRVKAPIQHFTKLVKSMSQKDYTIEVDP